MTDTSRWRLFPLRLPNGSGFLLQIFPMTSCRNCPIPIFSSSSMHCFSNLFCSSVSGGKCNLTVLVLACGHKGKHFHGVRVGGEITNIASGRFLRLQPQVPALFSDYQTFEPAVISPPPPIGFNPSLFD